MSDNGSTIVIGAGAAGLAAARTLHDAGQHVTVLEARDRVGGRAHTTYDFASHPVELGAEFIHGENVCTWKYMNQYGLDAVDQVPYTNVRGYMNGRLLDQAEFLTSPNAGLFFRTTSAAKAWQDSGAGDVDLAEACRAADGFFDKEPSDSELRLWNSAAAELLAADLHEVGVAGLFEQDHSDDGVSLYFRVAQGYSRLMDLLARDLDIRLNSPVDKIEWSAAGVAVHTKDGVVRGERAIVTLPIGVLQAGDVQFYPVLPPEKVAAIGGIGRGKIGKIILKFDSPVWPEDTTWLFTEHDSGLFWRPGRGREDEEPVITAYFGGSAVDRFAALGPGAVDEAVRHLEEIVDLPLADRVVDAMHVDWAADRFAKTGYSYLPPGATGLRAKLAAPLDRALFFAGEAASVLKPHCVHGAIESGWRAAREVMEANDRG
jgi:monoamine oxidase